MGLPFRRADSGIGASYALYGKLPARADFVRVNADHPAVAELDEIIQKSLERLSGHENGMAAYDASGTASFQLMSSDGRYWLRGVLAPSRDQAGRRYPLLAVSIAGVDEAVKYAAIGPIAHEVFFDGLREQVRNAIDNSVEALSCRQFLDAHIGLSEVPAEDLELALSVVDRFKATTSVSLFAQLLSEHQMGGNLEQALLNLAFYRAFLRRFDNPATKQLIVLPLPEGGGEQALIACTWLAVIEALANGRENTSHWHGNYAIVENANKKVVLLTSFSPMHDKFAIPILGAVVDDVPVLDLANELEAWSKHRLYSEVSYALSRFLGDPSLSIKDLCEFLRDVGHKLRDTI